jgi:hypothetical protein
MVCRRRAVRCSGCIDDGVGVFSPVQGLNMVNSLLIQDIGGLETPVMDSEYSVGRWNLGLTDDRGYVVGWAKNSSPVPAQKGWLIGLYSGSALYGLSNGEKPIHAFLVYDSTGNGWDIDTATGVVGSPRDLADGDLFFDEMDILFNGVLGDVSALPGYPLSGTAILPSMTVVIPEPTIALLSPSNNSTGITPALTLEWYINGNYTYEVYLGEDPNNLALFSEVSVDTLVLDANDIDCASTYYWKVAANDGTETIESEVYRFTTANCVCQEAYAGDVNNDCRVDILDLCILSENWLKESNRVWASQ